MDCLPGDPRKHEYLRQARQLPLKKRRERYETLLKELNPENNNHLYGIKSQVWCHDLTQKLVELELQKQERETEK
tara:strand:- start:544 stop:768 length:225 start_codon:yes stop_codon:yes gene_type:complete